MAELRSGDVGSPKLVSTSVFVSCARADLRLANELRVALAPRFNLQWLDFEDVPSRERWGMAVRAAIDASAIVLFIASPESVRSELCREELRLAASLGRRIVPIVRDSITLDTLPPEVRTSHALQISRRQDVTELSRSVASLLSPLEPESPRQSVDVLVLSGGANAPGTVGCTPALAELFARAARINSSFEPDFDLSFSSLLLGLLASGDWLSQWFQGYVGKAGVALEVLLRRRRLTAADLQQVARETAEAQRSETPWRMTSSAAKLLESAGRLRDQTAGAPDVLLDVRHLMAAYIYDPAGHDGDLRDLKLDPARWSTSFFAQVAGRFPAEMERWREVHRGKFPNEKLPLLENQGPSTHVASDRWTTNDTLGYKAYAYAIYRFMMHRETKPPLAISIQAPWGGGKTSLMRMIQKQLDPEAVELAEKEGTGAPVEAAPRMTLRAALTELKTWLGGKSERLPELSQPRSDNHRFTVWFNAWKYESGRQIWAGLTDAIMHQVADRLPANQRELFWLRLNLSRIDVDAVRRQVYDRIFSTAWRWARAWAGVAAAGVVASVTAAFAGWDSWGVGMGASTGLGLLGALGSHLTAEKKAKDEPADATLGSFLAAPDYSSELGFVHHVDIDLRRVLDVIPAYMKPLVIFVDDLDRCSPTKVAEVVEGLNLFLAGELPGCYLVLGMDAEMVAAALQAYHADMRAELPEDAAIPIGWRFMDKFIQLPFVIPPPEAPDLKAYAAALTTPTLSKEERDQADQLAQQLATEAADRITTRAAAHEVVAKAQVEQNLRPAVVEQLRHRLVAQGVERDLNARIEEYSDDTAEVKALVVQATEAFSNNPREIKRFVNTFRFHYFLWAAHEAQTGRRVVTPGQLQRWVVFAMKWPEVVRWVRRTGGREWRRPTRNGQRAEPNRLRLLERMGKMARDLRSWQAAAKKLLLLDPAKVRWLDDDDLVEFFYEEAKAREKLSDGSGKGLW